jgi:hypothetical protein
MFSEDINLIENVLIVVQLNQLLASTWNKVGQELEHGPNDLNMEDYEQELIQQIGEQRQALQDVEEALRAEDSEELSQVGFK